MLLTLDESLSEFAFGTMLCSEPMRQEQQHALPKL